MRKEGGSIDDSVNFLLANGVIVSPCRAGDTVYDDYLNEFYVTKLEIYDDTILIYGREEDIDYDDVFRLSDIGKIVFMTREEAEKALKEREENA